MMNKTDFRATEDLNDVNKVWLISKVNNSECESLILLLQYNTIQYNTIQYNTIQYNIIQYNTILYNTIQ